uniref:Uncharacterized protein n=1 Tax=uncultured prokaryote TaxID=198431 RepID=A0A0H5Q1F4_9ZZZZ|nr:hypothetical protein [uncultured prokaryote]
MAVFAIYIQKEARYFGQLRTFGNTYHYEVSDVQTFDDRVAAEYVADAERAVTNSDVTFLRWQTYGPTDGSQVDNVMREDGELTGSGQHLVEAGLYVEACVLVVWPLPRSPVTNRKRWLRKFLRSPGFGVDLGGTRAAGQDALTAEHIAELQDEYASVVTTNIGPSGTLDATICTADGVQPNADPIVRPYIYTRQIGR